MGDVGDFEPLEADAFRRDLRRRHADATLWLVCVLQAAALALGVQHGLALVDGGRGLDASDLLYADVVFMCLVTTYFYYFQLVSVLFVPPSLVQLLIPFSTGASALVLARTFDQPRTFLPAYLVFLLLSLAGFAYVLASNRPERYAPSMRNACELVAAECRKNIACLGAMALTTLAIWLLYPAGAGKSWNHDLAVIAVNGVIFSWMIYLTEVRFLPGLHRAAGTGSR